MEYINKIELRGRVGRCEIQNFGSSRLCRFSLATEYGYRARNGERVIDTNWFNISAWDAKGTIDFVKMKIGCIVSVIGRIRTYRYADSEGVERNGWDVQAYKVSIVENPDNEPIIPQSSL